MIKRPAFFLVSFLLVSCGEGNFPKDPIDLADFDWDNPINLTNHDYWDFDPDFSPDGQAIVFHSTRDPSPGNRGQIWIMNVDGSGLKQLTNTAQGTNHGATFSPDGTKIAFTSERDGNAEVYLMNADGSNQVNLTNGPGYESGPDWSPDGRYLAFFSGVQKPETDDWLPPGSPNRYWNSEIYIMDMKTREIRQVTFSETDDIYPTWSGDGTRLAFTSVRDGNEEIYIINVDGTGEHRLTFSKDNDKAPVWLPGDRYLQARDDSGDGEGDHSNIYMIDAESGLKKPITKGGVFFVGEVSPDQEVYIYSAFSEDSEAWLGQRADIYLIRKK